MIKMRLRLFALALFGTAVVFTPVHAQTRIDFTPHIGMYFPFNAAVDEASQGLEMRQVSAVVLGGRVAFHATRHFLIETTIDYTPSPTAVSFDNTVLDSDGGLVLASARGVYRLGRLKPQTPELQLSAGAGLVNRFGKAWESRGMTGTTDPAVVLGIAGRYPLGRDLPINLRLEIADYITYAQFGPESGITSRRRNHDTIWAVGFEIPMSGPENE
jgi:hypothetical protein